LSLISPLVFRCLSLSLMISLCRVAFQVNTVFTCNGDNDGFSFSTSYMTFTVPSSASTSLQCNFIVGDGAAVIIQSPITVNPVAGGMNASFTNIYRPALTISSTVVNIVSGMLSFTGPGSEVTSCTFNGNGILSVSGTTFGNGNTINIPCT
jgi:hypothetical protein